MIPEAGWPPPHILSRMGRRSDLKIADPGPIEITAVYRDLHPSRPKYDDSLLTPTDSLSIYDKSQQSGISG
jgi:hypothetical protein